MHYLVRLSPDAILKHWASDIAQCALWIAMRSCREIPAIRKSVRGLKNSQRGRKAFVFANGPSIRSLDLGAVAKTVRSGDRDLFAVNSYISSTASHIAPATHYVLSDPAHFRAIRQDQSSDVVDALATDVRKLVKSRPREIFVPFQYRAEATQVFGQNVRLFCDQEFRLWRNTCDIRWPRSFCSMTAFKALQIACFMGYDEIAVAGFDNDYFKRVTVDTENVVWEVDEHFYDMNGGQRRKVCPPNYLGNRVSEHLIANAMLFADLEQFASHNIVNLIPDSLVDAFPKRPQQT